MLPQRRFSRPTELIPIGPASVGLFVHSRHPEPERFVRRFREAIGRIPSDALRVLELYWSPRGPDLPKIVLTAEPFIDAEDCRGRAVGLCEDGGRTLTFSGPAIAEMPNGLARSLIVHELAHAHSAAEMFFSMLSPSEASAYADSLGDNRLLQFVAEVSADGRMRRWGFEPADLRLWTETFIRQAAARESGRFASRK